MTTPREPSASGGLLELRNVGKQYGTEPAVHALVAVDLAIAPGEWLSIAGPSGAGKSTLLNIIGCLDHPTTGKYFFDGVDAARLSDKQRAGLRSRRIGFVFQALSIATNRPADARSAHGLPSNASA
jgi:macrolide transport system ATP-binding/permease protein